ncbi:hypothetical protein ACLHDG_10305 [Sulfurovum sp. CS9]|uniref:hypothetical protein n=1 Tax=Sulfurovum sp. CS9 TaxID=3391146 RepID=UPI0039ECD0F8
MDRRTHVVQVRIIRNGEVLEDSEKLSLDPKHTMNHMVQGSEEGGLIYYEFTVEGSKDMYRGAVKLFIS